MEGAARSAQFLYQVFFGSQFGRSAEEFAGWMLSSNVYSRAFHVMLGMAPGLSNLGGGAAHYHFLALADLALNPSLDGATLLPLTQWSQNGIADLMPGKWFETACRIGAEVEAINVERCRSFSDVADEYVRFCGDICRRAGWEAPWQVSARLIEAADDLLQPAETLFLRCFDVRTTCPGLPPYFPLHPESRKAVTYIGTPMVAARDSSFSFSLRANAAAGSRWNRFAGRGDPDEAVMSLDAAAHLSDYIDQLMQDPGPFDGTRSDPHGIEDDFATAEHRH